MTESFFDRINKNKTLHTPDVLSCLANLSNDEVFTPPDVVNKMLDMLPQELFESPETTFLDPACKTGVFLREIAKRLIVGLENKIPDLQERIDHIFHNQLYAIAITELTSLMSRRSVYCSKSPDGRYSVSHFDNAEGNIRYKKIEHTWINDKCIYCGASIKSKLGDKLRGEELEAHAYEWIHTKKPEEIFNMQFDVIISNPPYQLSTGGSLDMQATPIYDKFVNMAKQLKPRYISMIIPSRWMNGGFALDKFREEMLDDKCIKVLHDYFNADKVFPGIALTGGVCYFLWEKTYDGKCSIFTHYDNDKIVESNRYLREDGCSTFIRFSEAISILNKVNNLNEIKFSTIVSPRDPFGLNYFEGKTERMFKPTIFKKENGLVGVYYFGYKAKGMGYVEKNKITTKQDVVDKYKVLISKANGAASKQAPYSVISAPFIAGPNECCNMTYLCIGCFDTKEEAENCVSYIKTKFFRFLVSLLKNTQNALRKVYEFVPLQDFSKSWNDAELYTKYSLNNEEIEFIESMIKTMDGSEEGDE